MTPRYKLHLYEIPTGLKFVLLTTPEKQDQVERLKTVYNTLFVPLVSSNPFQEVGQKVETKLFD